MEPGVLRAAALWLDDQLWNSEQSVKRCVDMALAGALTRRRVRRRIGYDIDLTNPRSFNEKVLWRMWHDRRPELITYCDKLATRDWVRDRLGRDRAEPLLTELLHVTADPRDLPPEVLTGGVVVKSNHGSARLVVLPAGQPVDRPALMDQTARWMRRGFGVGRGEWAYGSVPRRVLVERLLTDARGKPADDVKFYVFDGLTWYVRCILDRFGDCVRVALDRTGARHRICKPTDAPGNVRPVIPGFDAMRDIAEELGTGLDFLRIDFLWTEDRFQLNEVTAYPTAAAMPLGSLDDDLWLGSKWTLPSAGNGGPTPL